MSRAEQLRRALAEFLGQERYRKFIQKAHRNGRLYYWQEREWDRFVEARPEFDVDDEERACCLRVCHLHGDELRPGTVAVFHGCLDWDPAYVEVRNRQFPNTRMDVVSSEGRSFKGDHVEVWFCPSCREARATWEARRQARRSARRGPHERLG